MNMQVQDYREQQPDKIQRVAGYVARVLMWLALWFVVCAVTAFNDPRGWVLMTGYYLGFTAYLAPAALVLGVLKKTPLFIFGVGLVIVWAMIDGRWK